MIEQAFEQFADGGNQRVSLLAAEALVEAAQVVDPQQNQIAFGVLLTDYQLMGQANIEQAAVGQAGDAVLIGLFTQFFAARRFFGEQGLQFFHHLVHRGDHALEFRRARHFGQGEKLAAGDGLGLLHHIVQWPQLGAQQPATEDRTDQAAEQQPEQTADGTVPEFGQGELRMTEHFDPRGLFPAAHDQCITTLGLQVHQFTEPERYAFRCGIVAAAFDDDLVIRNAYHADAGEVTAVEDRADHQLDHRRVIHVRGHRQAQGCGGVLGVGTQLAEQLFARAFHTSDKTAGKGHDQEQANGEK